MNFSKNHVKISHYSSEESSQEDGQTRQYPIQGAQENNIQKKYMKFYQHEVGY
jgi:hypothetical protein